MKNKSVTLDIRAEDLDVIEAALHTKSKILDMQASAGGVGAREDLNAVKRILASISQQRPRDSARARPGFWNWLGRMCWSDSDPLKS